MATRKVVVIKTPTQLEAAGFVLGSDALGDPCYEKDGDIVHVNLFQYLGKTVTGTINDTSLTGNQGILPLFPDSAIESTTYQIDHAPGLEGHELDGEGGVKIYITVFQDASMNVRYNSARIHVPTEGVLSLKALMDSLVP